VIAVTSTEAGLAVHRSLHEPADGGAHRYYEVGIEHLAFEVDRRDEVDDAHARCLSGGAKIHFLPRSIATWRGVEPRPGGPFGAGWTVPTFFLYTFACNRVRADSHSILR
jgi:hypothetical protein